MFQGKDNVDLICSIGEIAGLFERVASLSEFLQQVVRTIAYHMHAAVCSVYLYDEESMELILSANQGLNTALIGKARLRLGEGITGKALEELRAIREGNAEKNPNFKEINGLDEEGFKAFLAVPIVRGLTRVGVIVVQDPVPDYFTENDEKALRAIAAQLASTIENAKLLLTLHDKQQSPATAESNHLEPGLIKGVRASGGIVCGPGTVIGHLGDTEESVGEEPAKNYTLDDFNRAVRQTEEQLEALQSQMDERMADVASLIFSAHLLILKDAQFSGEMTRRIDGGESPAQAITNVVRQYVELFEKSNSPMLKEKVYDVRDLGHRLLHNLMNKKADSSDYTGQIVIAPLLLPSEIIKLAAQGAQGLVLTGGGATSHAAILAQSLQLPMVLVREERLLRLPEGVLLLLDADQGNLFVNPAEDVRRNYKELLESSREAELRENEISESTESLDGVRVRLLANINLLSDLKVARRLKAEGVGLYRSEMPFIVRSDFPSEEEQYRIYRRIVEEMEGREVTFRTLDIGGDKMLSYFPRVSEANPFLGLRALRFSLRHRDVFCQQLRALLRSGVDADIGIMFPLVSSVDDFVEAREVLLSCAEQLATAGIAHNPRPKIGLMLELPSAVELVEDLAAEADFICIGTNDLVQYTLAVDRTNEDIANLYVPYHPAVLRALKRIAAAVTASGKELSICGEMASDIRLTSFLLGIGIRKFSLDARAIALVQRQIQKTKVRETEQQASTLLKKSRLRDIEAYITQTSAA